ncbi:hypothetical protein ACC706_38660, partial [Rhizobium johnstonii]
LIDPMVRYLAHAQRPFRWREAMAAFRKDAYHRRMEQMMVDAFGHGLQDLHLAPRKRRVGRQQGFQCLRLAFQIEQQP